MDSAVVEVLGWDEAFVGVRTGDPEANAPRLQTIRAPVLRLPRLPEAEPVEAGDAP